MHEKFLLIKGKHILVSFPFIFSFNIIVAHYTLLFHEDRVEDRYQFLNTNNRGCDCMSLAVTYTHLQTQMFMYTIVLFGVHVRMCMSGILF